MAIKGSATIELTNADGSKKIIQHDNMITNAPSDLLKSFRGEMPPIFKVTTWRTPYVKAIFGGILLFDETLDEAPDDYFIPGTNITGYASQDAYGGSDTTRGGFNAAESGVQDDGSYKLVWDFSTSQGNGTIKSLALCPNVMGKVGASETIDTGNYFYIADGSNNTGIRITRGSGVPFNANGYLLESSDSTEGLINSSYVPVAVYGGYIYAVDIDNAVYNSKNKNAYLSYNGGILNLYKFKGGIESVSVADVIGGGAFVEKIEVTLPSNFIEKIGKSVAIECDYKSGILRVFYCDLLDSFTPNNAVRYVEINMKDMSVSSSIFTNNTGVVISSSTYLPISSRQYPYYIGSEYIVSQGLVNGERKLYVTNKSDNTIVKEVRYSATHEFTFGSNYKFMPIFSSGKVLVFKTYSSSSSKVYWFILDMETGIVKGTNFTEYEVINSIDMGSYTCYGNAGTSLGFTTVMNPFVICTKNNLDTPVEKTANQTMKITYTLSEEGEV